MIKIFTLINLAGLFLFDLLFVTDIAVKQDLPASMDPGSEVRVTVSIDKGSVSGFAKLQIDLPPGLSATAIETKGASFTFADGKAKFIWMALPNQPSFTVSYTLGAAANAGGPLAVNGRFSYIEDNERKTVDLQPAVVRITGDQPSLAANAQPTAPATASVPVQAAPAANTNVNNNGGDGTPIPDAILPEGPGQNALQDPGNVTAARTVIPVSPSEALVEVRIVKGAVRGFGKLQETIPAGFSAVATETSDAIFSAKGTTAKFVWLNLPQDDAVRVAYRLVANGPVSGEFTVNGEFGYLVNDLSQRAVVGSSTFRLVNEALAQQQQAPKPVPVAVPVPEQPVVKNVPPVTPPPAVVTPVPEKPAQVTVPEPAKPVVTEPPVAKAPEAPTVTAAAKPARITGIATPERGITYKVQITAAHREVGKEYFEKRHRYSGDFSIEHHEGWIKYVTGRFDRYTAAKEQRQAYVDGNYNFPGPFVTAYNDGERITVQEALMIAKQRSAQ
jgi:hypothetical protein